ncbi:hypothetical protein [Brevibacterium yomogidense]|uniref:hypothetical protein n=1 Tax=Brevibacterium yomogidense TaxID=946573 RepID=UPI0018DF3DB0|nr:hypothetical protein [Brevibacterium yomogidense]
MVNDKLNENPGMPAATACRLIGEYVGIDKNTVQNWVKQNHVDTGETPGVTTDEKQRVLELDKENHELRRANEILRKASAPFVQAELDRR